MQMEGALIRAIPWAEVAEAAAVEEAERASIAGLVAVAMVANSPPDKENRNIYRASNLQYVR